MKKKLIENLPAPRITKNMKDFVVIAREPEKGILTLDVVEVAAREVQVRICVTKNEFANYYPETGKWDNKQISGIMLEMEYSGGLIFYPLYGKSNIQKVLGKKYESVHEVDCYEREIAAEKRWKTESRKKERCRERNARVPEPDKKMEQWLKRYVGQIHYIYYRRKGRYAQIACSACGHSGKFIMIPETYEEHSQKCLGFKPEHKMGGEPCPFCGIHGSWRAAGKTTGTYPHNDHRYIVDKVDGSVLVRYFEIEKYIQGTEYVASERFSITEVARSWFTDNKVQKDYRKYDWYRELMFWDDRNLSGLASFVKKAGKVRLKEDNILEGTPYRYSGLEDEIVQNDYTDAENYLMVYQKFPVIEMLGKLGMTRIKENLLECGLWRDVDWLLPTAKKAQDIFMVTKQRFNDLCRQNGDRCLLGIYQYEKTHGVRFKDELVELLYACRAAKTQIEVVSGHAKIEKAMNYVSKQMRKAGRGGMSECLQEYVDYLKALEQNNRQFTEHEVYPADLEEAHNREILLLNQKKHENKINELNMNNKNIKKDAAEYNRRFRYRNGDYEIRAPKDAGEIFMEGLRLNHCVGRMGYIEAMDRHETVILFLRRKAEKDVPFYTVEVKNGKIAQAYGYGDKKEEWESVGPFLEAFKDAKLNGVKAERKAG